MLEVIKLFSSSTQLNMNFPLFIKTKVLKNNDFSCFRTFMLYYFKMVTIFGILTLISRINFRLSSVEHEHSYSLKACTLMMMVLTVYRELSGVKLGEV